MDIRLKTQRNCVVLVNGMNLLQIFLMGHCRGQLEGWPSVQFSLLSVSKHFADFCFLSLATVDTCTSGHLEMP